MRSFVVAIASLSRAVRIAAAVPETNCGPLRIYLKLAVLFSKSKSGTSKESGPISPSTAVFIRTPSANKISLYLTNFLPLKRSSCATYGTRQNKHIRRVFRGDVFSQLPENVFSRTPRKGSVCTGQYFSCVWTCITDCFFENFERQGREAYAVSHVPDNRLLKF